MKLFSRLNVLLMFGSYIGTSNNGWNGPPGSTGTTQMTNEITAAAAVTETDATVSSRDEMNAYCIAIGWGPYGKSVRDRLRATYGVGGFTAGRNWTLTDIMGAHLAYTNINDFNGENAG